MPDEPAADLSMTWLRPSSRLWLARRLELAAVTAVVALVTVVPIGLSAGAPAALAVAAVIIAFAALCYAGLRGRFLAWGYAERADDLLVRRGVLVRRMSVVPYGRMQFIDVTAGPVDRLFGLATVQLHTAAAATDARIPGLAADEAARLRDRLAALGESQAAGL